MLELLSADKTGSAAGFPRSARREAAGVLSADNNGAPEPLEGSGGDLVQVKPHEFVGGHVALGDGLGPAPGATATGAHCRRRNSTESVGDAHPLILRAIVRMTSDCSQSGA
ncbi:hypothetical protein STSP_23770 [Streptomyces jeddahensis]|uniref:Uncharacterized protein n=1 Tax=Streptomyces jeddahensis TaxID=1716141 RepID=A0A177HUB4_9ACTN|nr:hypothetical protein STSP_23770 [Streptomyces jeddahensis]